MGDILDMTDEEIERRRRAREAGLAVPEIGNLGPGKDEAIGSAVDFLSSAGLSLMPESIQDPLKARGQAMAQEFMPSTSAAAEPAPGPAAIDPGQVQFAGQAGTALPGATSMGRGMGSSMRLGKGASVAPLRNAREELQAMPGRFRQQAEESANEIAGTRQQAREAIGQAAAAEMQAAEKQADIQRAGLAAFEEVRNEHQNTIEQAQQNVNLKMDDYRQRMGELQEMRIDPQRRYSGGKKVGAAIAMALGAMGAALSRGRNTAMDIIQSEIQRDVAAQESAIQKQKGVVGAAQAEVGMARQVFQDAASQKLAAENAALKGVQMEISAAAADSKSPMVAANAEKAVADLDMRIAENDRQIEGKQQALELQSGQAAAGAAQAEVAAGQRNVQISNQAKIQEQAAIAAKSKAVAKTVLESDVPAGLSVIQGKVPREKDRTRSQEITSSYNKANLLFKKLIAWRMKYGAEVTDREALRVGGDLLNDLTVELKNKKGMGANFTEMEKALLRLADDPGEVGYFLTSMKNMQQTMTEKTNLELKPFNYQLTAASRKARSKRKDK